MAKTIKVSFDYNGQHYDLKFSLKRDINQPEGYVLTNHKYNLDWSTDIVDETSFNVTRLDGYNEYLFEMVINKEDASFLRLLIWDADPDGVLLDDQGGTDNFEVEEY